MSIQQQALIEDTIKALNRAVKRKACESDSDSSIEHNTNRGYKLKKRARYVHQGQLPGPAGPAIEREIVELSGYQRTIISHNPPLVDENGYLLDSEDDEERVQAAIAAAVDENPYSSIRLEQILAPLTAITDLPAHQTLSRPFTSKALTELVAQGSALMRKENAALWKVKPLLTKLCGDHTWIPCELMISATDQDLFSEDHAVPFRSSMNRGTATPNSNNRHSASARNGEASKMLEAASSGDTQSGDQGDIVMVDAGTSVTAAALTEADLEKAPKVAVKDEAPVPESAANKVAQNTESKNKDDYRLTMNGILPPEKLKEENPLLVSSKEEGSNSALAERRHSERATEAQASGKEGIPTVDAGQSGLQLPSGTPDLLEELFIHPLFLAPRSAHPDRDLGLPEPEAEDVRRLVQLYVQKQEEVCRGTTQLYEGLLKADRLRKMVLRWAKAEAHCGPNRDMSDGEDWYDKEEWGLTDDLKKGQDEEEEDTAQTQKKTRSRR